MTPGRLPSMKTSASATRRWTTAAALGPGTGIAVPDGRSMRITSAPMSASIIPPNGAAPSPAASTTTMPDSGPGRAFIGWSSRDAEVDDAAHQLAVAQVGVGLVDVVEPVPPGDHLVELQASRPIEPGQHRNVGPRVARAEYGAAQRLVHQREVLQAEVDRPRRLRGHAGDHAVAALAGELQRGLDVGFFDERRRQYDAVGHHAVGEVADQVERLLGGCGGVGGTELQGRLLLELDGVDGDDPRRTVDARALDGGGADAAGS